jgi:Spy/CpxP family protein refolding chaperone
MLVLAAFVAVAATGGAAGAQGTPPERGDNATRRDSLQARVQARMAQVMRTQLGLNDEQIRRLQATNRRFEGQRRELFERERRVRIELRAAIEIGDSTQNAKIGPLLDQTIQLQRQRLDLLEAEQRELATFLTPLQRAKLYGLEEQMRRRVEEMRESGPPERPLLRPGAGARPGGGVRRPPAFR